MARIKVNKVDVLNWIDRHWLSLLASIAAMSVLLMLIGLYPGMMSNDSIHQLIETYTPGVGLVTDWHPPIFVYLWKLLVALTGKAGSMYALQLLVYWGSLGLLAMSIYLRTKRKSLSLLPFLVGILPHTIGLTSVIWKDVHMALAYLAATALLLILPQTSSRRLRIAAGLGVMGFLVYGTMTRYNALIAVLPFVVYCASQYRLCFTKLRRSTYVVLAVFVAVLVSLILTQIIPARHANPSAAVMVDDVLAISDGKSSGSDELNGLISNAQAYCRERKIYTNTFWLCFDDKGRTAVVEKDFSDLRALWASVILRQPIRYVSYKLYTFTLFLFPPHSQVYVLPPDGIVSNPFGLEIKSQKASLAMQAYVLNFGYNDLTWLFRPWFWLIISIALIARTYRKRGHYRNIVLVLASSSILNIVSYFPAAVSNDYRYIYWSALATSMGLLLAFVSYRTTPTSLRKRKAR